jgi:PCI domain
VVAMTSLVDAYQRNNINEFEKTLKTNRHASAAGCAQMHAGLGHLRIGWCHAISGQQNALPHCRQTIMADSFISQYIEDLLKNIRMQVCSCTRIQLAHEIGFATSQQLLHVMTASCLFTGGIETHTAIYAHSDTICVQAAERARSGCGAAASVPHS